MASRVIVALAALVAAALTARLGLWQLDRAEQKEAVQASVQARTLMPEVTNADLADSPTAAAAQHHRVARVQGRWMAQHTVFLDNRPMNGRAGFFVLTPLRLADGSALLVQRGWQPRDLRDRTLTQPVPTPEDADVQVRGRLAPPPSRLMEFDGAPQGALRQNVELTALSQEIGLTLRPLSMQQLEPALVCDGADCKATVEDGLARDWTVVAGSADKNRGYAAQWFALSALVVGLYLWFQWLAPMRKRAGMREGKHQE